MSETIEEHMHRDKQREAFKADALAAWRDYQEAGLHATGEEVSDWLRSWGTADEQITPECHE